MNPIQDQGWAGMEKKKQDGGLDGVKKFETKRKEKKRNNGGDGDDG